MHSLIHVAHTHSSSGISREAMGVQSLTSLSVGTRTMRPPLPLLQSDEGEDREAAAWAEWIVSAMEESFAVTSEGGREELWRVRC